MSREKREPMRAERRESSNNERPCEKERERKSVRARVRERGRERERE